MTTKRVRESMTIEQIKACIFVYEETVKSEKAVRAKLTEAGLEDRVIRMYEMHPSSHEWADDLRDELKRREELDGVMDLIYRNSYSDPSSDRIQPLDERAQWEQEQVRRQAEAVIGFLKPEPLAQWEIDLLNSGKD